MEENAQAYKGWEKFLCQNCKDMLTKEMMPIYENINSGSLWLRQKAKVQLAKKQLNLYKKFCPTCLEKLKTQLHKEGKI